MGANNICFETLHVPRFPQIQPPSESEQPRGHLGSSEGAGQFGGGIEPHYVTTTILIDGYVFAHCLCGANSMPLLTVERARLWLCPRQDAESTIARNAALLASALARVHAFENGR
jgi:hypothetical protein